MFMLVFAGLAAVGCSKNDEILPETKGLVPATTVANNDPYAQCSDGSMILYNCAGRRCQVYRYYPDEGYMQARPEAEFIPQEDRWAYSYEALGLREYNYYVLRVDGDDIATFYYEETCRSK